MARQRNVGKQPHRGTYVRAWPCECGKRGYKRREDAKLVVKEIRREGSTRPGHLEAYQCEVDPDYWHVGHRPACDNAPNLNDPGTWTDE
jgi:hypothetical protein